MDDKLILVQENIAEIGMTVGCLIADGSLPKSKLDIPSSDIAAAIVKWAHEFEDQYGRHAPDWYENLPEIGNPLGYLDAIDNFTELKLYREGWLTEEYAQTLPWLPQAPHGWAVEGGETE